ncbi:DEAD/DEAH box helicase [Leucobacter sp. UT-8R-CII-1-4]|uniref:DEAD/DEAH box helicase n=1 Tax=Leucobacter sp. UT-8R-CII-1-4 TaxID=3040075 RepID=UPI0024A9BE99|nr:DEAD/DEAH box helicase [Leucobacter sp. UT-8R-CII-1-4]MDI6023328.1 DEAD/DEAH box helicase [Leucobacter sp. UT-8R-CII-1-4]
MTTPSFADLGVPNPLIQALEKNGKDSPFPIQRDTLPDTLKGRDVLGRGRTGSGKTIAFAIPLVANLVDGAERKRRPNRPRGIVLAPTRELVTQIAETVKMLADPVGLRVTTIFGGVPQRRQEAVLERGVDIVVAAPGRLDDLMRQKLVSLDGVEITVLDEADHMADMGFLPVVTRILNATPKQGQRLLFSATLDNGIDNIVKKYLHDPIMHSVDSAESPVPQLTHHVFEVASGAGKDQLIEALASGTARRIFFTRMKHQAKKFAKQLTAKGIPAVELQGNLSQNARDRNLAEFVSGQAKVLVATDVAARGVHVDGVDLVVHIDPPVEHKAYLHRSGRTARAGNEGDVVTIVLPEQRGEMRQIMRAAKIQVTPRSVRLDDPELAELIGEVAPKVDPREVERRRNEAQSSQQRAAGHNPAGAGKSQGANARRKRARAQGQGGQGAAQGQGRGAGQGSASSSRQNSNSRRGSQGGQQAEQQGQRRRSGNGGNGGNGGGRSGGSGSSNTSYSTSSPGLSPSFQSPKPRQGGSRRVRSGN